MLTEEIRGAIKGTLDCCGLSVNRVIELIKSRVNGASLDQLFAAAVAVLREQAEQIVELEIEIDELANTIDHLEEELREVAQ